MKGKWRRSLQGILLWIACTGGMVCALAQTAWSAEEVSSILRQYKGYEVSRKNYEAYEVKPFGPPPLVGIPQVAEGRFPYSPRGAEVRTRSRLADAHQGIRLYRRLKCANCHQRQARNLHTIRAGLECRQCHLGEPIAGIHYYYSPMNPIRRHAYVCSKCHEGAGASFAAYQVHTPAPAASDARAEFPQLFYVFWGMVALAVGTFAVFLPHAFLWGIREMLVKGVGAASKKRLRLRRFSPVQRTFHAVLAMAFLTQGATGLSRMYMETAWGRRLGSLFGGYEGALRVHEIVGLMMIVGFALHLLYLFLILDWRKLPKTLFGPDSLLPRPADIREFFQHLAWIVGRGAAPRFDRWGYWEKFDYWAVFWGIPVLGLTGILLAYPLLASRVIPGWGLNLAFWVHRIEAALAMVHVLTIHFFVAHLRRPNFPLDGTIFEGGADLAAVEHERPAWIDRLAADGRLDQNLMRPASLRFRTAYTVFGLTAVAVGLYLLVGGLINATSVTWW